MNKHLKHLALAVIVLIAALASCTPAPKCPETKTPSVKATTSVRFVGLNRAGPEYGDDWDGWTGQTYYEWPTTTNRRAEFAYYRNKGVNTIRLPISWERLQHTLNGPLDATYQAKMVEYVNEATVTYGFNLVLDLHNYGRYATGAFNSTGGQVSTYTQRTLGDGVLTFAHVSDVWVKLGTIFKDNPKVIFNLMNEQHDAAGTLDSTAIFGGYQDVLNALRSTGATQLVLFPNTRSSDTHHWSTWSPEGGPLDSAIAAKVVDPANNLAYDMHSYQGTDSWNADIQVVTNWARANGKKLFLSELGTTSGSAAVSTILTYLNANSDVWLGWTTWNLDPYTIMVTNLSTGVVTDTAKMAWYAPFLVTSPPAPPPVCTFTYSPWSACQANGTQTRTVVTASPDGCTGTPTIVQSCTYVPPTTTTDTDGDGIIDTSDACPKVKGIKTSDPRTNGCRPLAVTAVKTYDWGTGYCKQYYFKNNNPMPMTWKTMTIYLNDGKLRGYDNGSWGAVFPNPNATGKVVVTPAGNATVQPGQRLQTVGFCADYGPTKYVGTSGGLTY